MYNVQFQMFSLILTVSLQNKTFKTQQNNKFFSLITNNYSAQFYSYERSKDLPTRHMNTPH